MLLMKVTSGKVKEGKIMKTLRTLFVAAVTAAALVSCSKEVNTDDQSSNKKDFSFKFFANVENVGTRATLTPNANETSFAAAWEDEDSMDLSAFSIDAEFDESGYAVWSEQDQAFNAVFGGIDVPTGEYEWLYYGYYPAKESIPFGSPREQQGNAYNSLYDVMYGETDAITAEFGKDANGDPLVIPMSRLPGIAYFHITGGPEEDVISATLSAEGIAAEVVNIEYVESVPAVTVSDETPRYDEITINFAQGTAPQATDLQLWFNVLPGQYQNLKLTIVTENHIAVLAPTATFNYVAGKLNKAVLNQLNWQSFEKAPKGTVLLSETFEDFVADATPTAPGNNSVVYGNATVSYSCVKGGTDTKIYDENIAGGTSPELLVSKTNGEFAISGIPTGYHTSLTVTWNSNNTNIKLNYADETTTGTLVPGTTKQYMALVTVPAGTASVNLGFKNTTNSNGRLDNIQITAGVSNAPAGLSYTVTEFEAVLGDDFEEPVLTNQHSLTVTYASSDTDVAEVDAATGAVTIKALGEATITASSEATDDYEAGEASYTITVVAATLSLSEGTTPAKASCAADATVTFTVTSNIAWTAAVDTDGDVNNIVKSVTAEDDVVTVTFNKNTDAVEKTAVIAVTPTNNVHSDLKKYITVTQEKFENTDVLTADLIGVSSYSNWSGVSVVSDAVYAGNSTKNGSGDIQMRAQDPSGIVSTTSGGYIRKVKITWGTGNASQGRTLNVYASNKAYVSAADLYAAGVQPVASFTSNDQNGVVEYTFTSDYEYVGVRSSSGALYLADVAFTWEKVDPNAPRFGAEIVGDANFAADVTTGTVQVTGNVAWTATATNGATLSPASGTGEATIAVTMPENTDIQNSKSYVVTVSTTAQVTPNSYELTFTQDPAPDPNQRDGSLERPYNATDVLGLTTLPTDKVYVAGTISELGEFSDSYHNYTYTITDGTSSALVYRGKYLGDDNFTSADQLKVGDEVIVYGNINQYQNANQLGQGNYLYSLNGVTTLPTITKTDISNVPADGVSGASTTVTFANNDGWTASVTPDGTVVTAASISGNTITYTVAANSAGARSGSITVSLSRTGFTPVTSTISVDQLAGVNGGSYTITFKKNTGDGSSVTTSTACSAIVSEGASYLSGNVVTASNVYYNGSDGLKLGKSGGSGKIKMNLASAVTPTSIVVSAKRYNASKAVTLKVNGSNTQNVTGSSFADFTYTITSEITYLEIESSQYCWVESITVNY